jgi:PAS domain-containing protein
MVFAKRLDARFLHAVAEGYGVLQPRLMSPDAAAPAASFPLAAADGTPLGFVAWQPERPGQELLRRVLPWLIGALLVFAAFTGVVMRSIQRAVAAIRFNETRFRDIAEASSDWIWETDGELRIEFVSERFEAVTGVPRKALLGVRCASSCTRRRGPSAGRAIWAIWPGSIRSAICAAGSTARATSSRRCAWRASRSSTRRATSRAIAARRPTSAPRSRPRRRPGTPPATTR